MKDIGQLRFFIAIVEEKFLLQSKDYAKIYW